MYKGIFESIARDIHERAMVVQYSEEMSYYEKWLTLYTLLHLMYDFADTFRKLSVNFDRDRFFQSCGVRKIMDEDIYEHVSNKVKKQKGHPYPVFGEE
jgi:hypothetical protein